MRLAAAQLHASEERFRLLVEGVKDYAIFLLDTRGYITSWNKGAHRIKGYTAEEIIGQHFSIFYPPREIESRKPWRELEIAAVEGRFEEEGWRLRKDGRRFWANVLITALYTPEGHVHGYAKVTRDLTERRATERRLEAMRRREVAKLREHARRMADLEATKSDFLRLASHELRGPMSVIRGYLSLLQEGDLGELGEQAQQVVALLMTKTEEANAIVNQLLETARLEENRMVLKLELVDLRDIVTAAAARARTLASARHRITVDTSPDPVLANLDVDRIRTVVQNLLDNAVKYSPGGGPVECAVVDSPETGEAVVVVRDEGLGISREDMPRLFSRFGRLVTPENSNVPGTGLGLYLSRELVRRHHGDITVVSAEGQGTTFRISLPRA
ncbi:MAG TPA: PAS domain-containing sensor histidine kinase [Candidatus Dormibacteraeota bacterium]|nr:PAS domain-containing sensor histidine kinase [Candidatus Dormibacteraeota bacterium]